MRRGRRESQQDCGGDELFVVELITARRQVLEA